MRRVSIWFAGFALVGLGQLISLGGQPANAIRKQGADSAAPQPMSGAELSELGDPMFLLVLKDHPNESRLDEIEKLIMGSQGQRQLFVVDERLQVSTSGESRRAVIAYRGTNGAVRLDPNISLSAAFDDREFTSGFLEAWGWDDARSRYNYYKLDGNPATWKFRGSSAGADKLMTGQRQGTCMACHINGGPIMKELPIPWNNWHSFRNSVGYLSSSSTQHWAIAESARFRDLRGAEGLETTFILPSIRQFNGRRVAELSKALPPGRRHEVSDGRRMLRSLFATTEYNITSAGQASGQHPFAKANASTEAISVPDTFFLNANLLAGGGFTQYQGVGIPEARQFGSVAGIPPQEYRDAVARSKTFIGGIPGDANFAWFVPEASHIDNQFVDILVRRGVVTAEFVAAALAVDLENPVFSVRREALLSAIPVQFQFAALEPGDVPAAHPDALTREVISNLKTQNPLPGSPQLDFLELLESPNPVDAARARVATYLERVRTRLADPKQRAAEIDRLYQTMLARRAQATAHNPTLVESAFLFPISKP